MAAKTGLRAVGRGERRLVGDLEKVFRALKKLGKSEKTWKLVGEA
jgi:hypothetical protein